MQKNELKSRWIYSSIVMLIFFQSCLNDLGPAKNETQQAYASFLMKNETKLEIIAAKCYALQIHYATTDSILKILPADSLREVIENINYISLHILPGYVSYDFKLNSKENKCVDFFLAKNFMITATKESWSVKVIDKSPCF
jgi:hypothetical protein